MTYFSANLTNIPEIAANLKQIHDRLSLVGQELKEEIVEHTSRFEGDTKESFLVAQKTYDTSHESMTTQLYASQTALGQIGELLVMGERRGAGLWQQ